MLTPQEVQERTFEKAVFGGYDMGEIDDFLDILTEDYTNLYKENAVLKNKMKVLVRAVEEYREKEQSINSAIQNAQRNADAIIAQAQAQASGITGGAKPEEPDHAAYAAREAVVAEDIIAQEEKLTALRKSIQAYVSSARESLRREDELLETLSSASPQEAPAAAYEPPAQPEVILDEPTVAFKSAYVEDVAAEIERSVSRTFQEEEAEAPLQPDARKTKFEFIELQFGKDYEL